MFKLNKLSKVPSIRTILNLSVALTITSFILSGCSDETLETVSTTANSPTVKTNHPNIIIFYVDDLGYGDLSAYGATSIQTPNIDKLSKNGIRFTDAHSTASTGTSSHYSLLTGEYGFRENVTLLYEDTALIIPKIKPTLPKKLKQAGYSTAIVGKWLLGLGQGTSPLNWNEEISPGPFDIGFDYSFIIPGAADKVPTVYIEDHHVLNLDKDDPLEVNYNQKIGNRPTGTDNPELLLQKADSHHSGSIINGISRKGWMKGGTSAEYKDEDFSTVLTNMAKFFIMDSKESPFFLFFSFHDIHVPRNSNEMFKGKSNMGPRGDAILQMDWITGQIIETLTDQGILDDTLIIFTSDNGPVLIDGYDDQSIELLGTHKPAGEFRGGKYSAYEAGTRVPTIVHYPAKVKAGTSNALMSQVDLYASLAHLVGLPLNNNEAIDSENHLNAWLNASNKGRDAILQESQTFSLRTKEWKYIMPSKKQLDLNKNHKNIESGISLMPQLYNLAKDTSEQNNLATKYPNEVKAYQEKIDSIKSKSKRKTL